MAIITNDTRKFLLDELFTDFDSSATSYYITIGRSNNWDNAEDSAPPAFNTGREIRNFQLAAQSSIKVEDKSFVVPRYNWSSGTTYSQYDDNIVGFPNQPYYVMNDNNQVYLCVQRAVDTTTGLAKPSTVQPTGNTSGTPFETADDYIWKFLYSIGPLDASKYLAANFMPVKLQGTLNPDSPASDVEQKAVQDAAVAGQIVGFAIDSGGGGVTPYTSATATVVGNGTGCEIAISIAGGTITSATLDDSAGGIPMGQGYDYAAVTVTGNGSPPAKIRAILSSTTSPLGLGGDPREDLRSNSVMFNAIPDGDEGGDFLIDEQNFRQVGIIRNPLDASGSLYTASTASNLKKIELDNATEAEAYNIDALITGNTSGAKALIDRVDATGLWYHQDETTGFLNFDSAETITDGTNTATVTNHYPITSGTSPEFDTMTGETLYIDNRPQVTRSSTQQEDIKLVIQI